MEAINSSLLCKSLPSIEGKKKKVISERKHVLYFSLYWHLSVLVYTKDICNELQNKKRANKTMLV